MDNNNETPCGLPQPKPVRLVEPVNISTDWQQVRIQAAIAAMQTVDDHVSTVEELAERCVRYADALIAELERKNDVYAEARRLAAINTASVCENMTKLQNELQKKGEQQ